MAHPDHLAAARAQQASPLRLCLALAAAVVFPAAVVFVRPSFFSNAAEAMNLAPRVGALAYLFVTVTTEEAVKAAAIGVADLRRSRFSWFWISAAVAAIVGLVEVGLRGLLYLSRIDLDVLVLAGLRTTSGHIALSLVCVTLARMMGSWLVPVVVVGALHALVNYGGRATGASSLYDNATFAIFVAVIVAAVVWRSRFDWRATVDQN